MSAFVFGTPGGSLKTGQSWAANDAVLRHGAAGEQRTADLLNSLPDNFAVFHDLRVPTKKITANIDHVVLTGKHLIIIDSKAWAGGIYWSHGSKNRRGLSAVDHVGKKTMQIAASSMQAALGGHGGVIHQPVIAVWPSSTIKAPVLLNPYTPASKIIHGSRLMTHIRKTVRFKTSPPDPGLVNELRKLLIVS